MTGSEMQQIRRLLGKSQQQLADELETSQKQVSLLEGRESIPAGTAEKITAVLLAKLDEGLAPAPGPTRARPILSSNYGWTRDVFEQLKAESDVRVREIFVRATVSPSGTKGFADLRVDIRFRGLHLPPNRPLYLDHLPLSEGPEGKKQPFRLTVGRNRKVGVRATIQEDDEARERSWEHALAYEIHNADEHDIITIPMEARQGINLGQSDAVGFPLYADIVAERLAIEVRFDAGIRPIPTNLPPQVWPIRRTSFRPGSLAPYFDPVPPYETKQATTYSFGPLMYPRGGFGYCLSWASLV